MKISETWLREWVNPKLDRDALCTALTMSGFEVEEAVAVAGDFKGVVVGQIKSINKHPEADRLNLCEVDVGAKALLNIVCGADNVRVGMKAPVAMLGAELPGLTIKPAKIRGVASEGMMCSAKELGMAEESTGLLVLPDDAPLGKDIREYLQLNDSAIDISITPNRGDCLSVRGMSREIGAITNSPVTTVKVIEAIKKSRDTLPVQVIDTHGCPHYIGRVIRHVKADIATPVWMKERLRRSGHRSIHPIVDVTNYVMLELGQPMHAFDLQKLQGGIQVRLAKDGETIDLLDGSTKVLNNKTLVIADHQGPVAIAGVMGGMDSCVTLTTTDIFLESAYFSPAVVAAQRQALMLNSDSAYRYERGVDPALQKLAMERATALILEIAGGEAGPIIEAHTHEALPKKREIRLSDERVVKLLGTAIPSVDIKRILTALGFGCKREGDKWIVLPPSWRFDVSLPEDVIEEISRIYGFDKIPMHPMSGNLCIGVKVPESNTHTALRQALTALGFHEVISYSFIDKALQQQINPDVLFKELKNPMTAEMGVMRTSLFGGLLQTLMYNSSRQQHRIKLFEIGACFFPDNTGKVHETQYLGGLISGPSVPYQWGMPEKSVDFFDLKGVLENIFLGIYPNHRLTCQPEVHTALHPGQSAAIYLNGVKIGIIGSIHPILMQSLGLKERAYLFEVDLSALPPHIISSPRLVSKFPEIRRDLAILLGETIPAAKIQDTIKGSAGDWLKECFIFDVYQGQGVAPGSKSVALGMILQHPDRTLTDEDIVAVTDRVVRALKEQLGAELRS